MTLNEIKTKLEAGIEKAKVSVEGDGCNCSAVIISPIFTDMPLLQRQRKVLSVVNKEIKSGELHALSIKAYTPNEI